MKIKIGQLRKIISETITESYGSGRAIGALRASIDGDLRYTDRLRVSYNQDDDTVTVSVSESAPAGGMDSFTPSISRDSYSETYPADDLKSIMNSIKYAVGSSKYAFKRYGKPTKNFKWVKSLVGLNMANLAASIAQARGE
jgi:hypothetical protein